MEGVGRKGVWTNIKFIAVVICGVSKSIQLFFINLIAAFCMCFLAQGLHSSELDSSLESSWEWMLNFKEQVYSMAFQVNIDHLIT